MTSGRTYCAALFALVLALLTGCGTPGAPMPPSLNLPRPVEDLRATRRGDKVTLTWPPPRETTDKQRIRHPGITRVCRSIVPLMVPASSATTPPAECRQAIAELPAAGSVPIAAGQGKPGEATFVDALSPELQELHALDLAGYAVEVLNRAGRSAGLSNAAAVPLAPAWPPPDAISARVVADAVVLTWSGRPDTRQEPSPSSDREFRIGPKTYRVLRQEAAVGVGKPGSAVALGEVPISAETQYSFADHNFEWEKTYEYWIDTKTIVMAPAGQQPTSVPGMESPPVTVVAHDVFPPAVPSGVQAVFTALGSQRFIDLTWTPNTEPDLAGYNVYRREQSGAAAETAGPPAKINGELLKTPTFRYGNVAPGHTYWYSVSAVDVRGNESARSSETSETVPAQP
jgi:hypothetical protein